MRAVRLTALAALIVVLAAISPAVSAEPAAIGDARGAQSKLDDLAHEMMQRMLEVEKDTNAKKIPVYASRNEHLKKVEGFWARTIMNHPSHGSWFGGNDREILPFVTDLSVTDIDASQHQFEITMELKRNPYIANTKLWRKVTGYDPDEQEVSGVEWLGDNKPTMATLFSFFDKEGPKLDPQVVTDITHVMRYEFFQNPFTYHDIPTFDELAAREQAEADLDHPEEGMATADDFPLQEVGEPGDEAVHEVAPEHEAGGEAFHEEAPVDPIQPAGGEPAEPAHGDGL